MKKLCDDQLAASQELRTPPTTISLPAVTETWTITQEHMVGDRLKLQERPLCHLHLPGDLRDSSWRPLLTAFLVPRADKAFNVCLQPINEKPQLKYARLTSS